MMSLSIRQPWAEFIMAGIKPLENRVWFASYKGVLLIHASRKFDNEWQEKLPSIRAVIEGKKLYNKKVITSFGKINWQLGGIIGAVLMTGCDMLHNNPWCTYGCWYHRYRYPARFKKIITYTGRMKLFDVQIPLRDFDARDLKDIADLHSAAVTLGIENTNGGTVVE